MDLREHKNAIKRFLAIFLGSCSSLTLLKTEIEHLQHFLERSKVKLMEDFEV